VISNTYSRGLRTQGLKKMGKNGMKGISQRGEKQSTIQRKRSDIGRVEKIGQRRGQDSIKFYMGFATGSVIQCPIL